MFLSNDGGGKALVFEQYLMMTLVIASLHHQRAFDLSGNVLAVPANIGLAQQVAQMTEWVASFVRHALHFYIVDSNVLRSGPRSLAARQERLSSIAV